ncbi:FAD-dependent monooxygenase azaH [Lasiodiplodia hormozganensis]|uniref:FAD-dependent monooxygenase azaH n=1 Tax=Lasiodiplodia hormozganensis TaxID=869390 RepID=A0AA39XUM3_9PEZI|nr:FAD-dependent monooxygenase azaH [Lasiodiplodia hormozganensis]
MPIKIIIVGGGIAGLTAAAALRRNGHEIKIFEQSSFSNEVGAAANLPPNVMPVLRQIEADENIMKPIQAYALRVVPKDGKQPMIAMDPGMFEAETGIKARWLLSHRADIHACLRDAATRPIPGTSTPEFHLSSRVVAVDAQAGTVTFQDGTTESADLIIGADGLHSVSIKEVIGEPPVINTGQNCFRFLVPTEKVLNNPRTRSFITRAGVNTLDAIFDNDAKLKCMIYPCRQGSLLNLLVIHPSEHTNADLQGGWHSPGSMETLKTMMSGYYPQLQEVVAMAEDLKLWSFSTRDPPPTYHKDRLVLIGDAAHHMLSHYGQGAVQGMEDAGALGVLLDATTIPASLPARLKAWNAMRYPRGTAIAIFGRTDLSQIDTVLPLAKKFVPGVEKPADMTKWLWAYDVVEDAKETLEELKREGEV